MNKRRRETFIMQLCDGKKYSTYILELIRNNGITNINGGSSYETNADEEVSFSFLMFDYFDVLYAKSCVVRRKNI